jgi:alkylhydroperoxidase family enzyme
LLGDRAHVEAVLDDYVAAPISAEEKVLLAFIEKVVRRSNRICQADVDEAKVVGWSDEALYDAITVCALFKFYNTWIDATGVQDMPSSAYEMSGKRLATAGYAPESDGG